MAEKEVGNAENIRKVKDSRNARNSREARKSRNAGNSRNTKDLVEKTLEENSDVFGDIVNAFIYSGRQKVEAEALEQAGLRSVYKADRKLRAQERDAAKYWRNTEFRIAMFGLENQTQPEDDMPFRIIGYDGAAYRDQLYPEKDKRGRWRKNRNPRYPVVTLLLYFGYEKHWDKALTLYEALKDIPEDLRPYVNDYKINLVEVAWLTDEQLDMLQSDFWIVADYFVQMRKTRDYIPSKRQIVHVQDVLQTMAVLTGDRRFEDAVNRNKEEEVSQNMCEVLDRVENRGIEKGIRQGINDINALNIRLIKENRLDDLKRAAADAVYQSQLLRELFPQKQH